ncbi:MAG TPA: hypothetical protein VEY88_03690 [Archangium sp.]|nr:hypothetical protein [Archangium sp.]
MQTNEANTTPKSSRVDRALQTAGLVLDLLQLIAVLAALRGQS